MKKSKTKSIKCPHCDGQLSLEIIVHDSTAFRSSKVKEGLKKSKVKLGKPRKYDWAEIHRQWIEGKNIHTLAKEYGSTLNTIRYILKKAAPPPNP